MSNAALSGTSLTDAPWGPGDDYVTLSSQATLQTAGLTSTSAGLSSGAGTGALTAPQMMPPLPDIASATVPAEVMDSTALLPELVFIPPEADTPGQIRSAGQDFDGDDQADLIFRDPLTGTAALRLLDGISIREEIELNPPIRDGNWRIAGSGNFNGDDFADLVWSNTATGQNLIWLLNNGQATQAVALPPELDRNWSIQGIGNFDSDLEADDLLWFNRETGARRVWLMDGTTRSQIVDIEPQTAAPGEFLGVGDFDQNGTSDLIWRDGSDRILIWQMQGTQLIDTQQIDAAPNLDASRSDEWVLSAAADFSGDGQVDLLWQRPGTASRAAERSLWIIDDFTLLGEINFAEFPNPDFSDPAAGFDIQFDYRFDTVGWFTSERRAALEAAADVWERVLLDDFEDTPAGTATPFVRNPETDANVTTPGQQQNIFLTDEPIDDIVIFVGTQSLGANGSLGRAGSSGFFSNESRYVGNDFEPWAGSVTFNRDANWFFDPTPATDNDIPFDQSDFISTAVHEIAHVLGFSRNINAFARFVDNSGTRFVGPNALERTNGIGIPLEDEDDSHIEDGFEFNGSGETALDPISFTGRRQLPTVLDLAIFDDIGYTVDYSQASQNQSEPA